MSESKPPVNAPPAGAGRTFAPRSEAFQRFMAAPLIVASILMVATATLAVLAWIGGTAEGERLQIDLNGACSQPALPLFQARVDEMGLGDPRITATASGVRIEATMPGTSDEETTQVPSLLARRGQLIAGPPEAPVFTRDDIETAEIRLDESGLPYTWLSLNKRALEALTTAAEAHPDDEMVITVDTFDAPPRPYSKPVTEGGIRLLPGEGITRERMRTAADHAIVLTHGPLPCDWHVGSVTTLDPIEGDG